MELAVVFHSLTTTTHPPNVKLPSSGQQVTGRLSTRKVSVDGGGGERAQNPLVKDTTLHNSNPHLEVSTLNLELKAI